MAKRSTERLIADRYTLQRTLGRGGMGVVWRARDNLLDRDVAVKEVQLPPSLNDEEREAIRARVMREARAAARLNHPNVVTLYDVVREEERTFIVMELVEAPTLAEVVRDRGPLPAAEVAAIGLQLLDALRAAHQVGIVHRDVKPGNVMVPPGEGGAKLADFGIASLAGDPQLTSTGLVLGSPAYMAPEQANGQLSGPPVDLWALGATMYFAVEGEPPFERGGAVPTLTAVVNEPPRPMRRAGPLEAAVLGLLAKTPAERPSAGQLRPQLERIAGRGARRVTPTLVLPPQPAEDRHPTTPLPAVPAPVPPRPETPTLRQPADAEQAAAPASQPETEAPTVRQPADAEQAPAPASPPEAETPEVPTVRQPADAEPPRAEPEGDQPEAAETTETEAPTARPPADAEQAGAEPEGDRAAAAAQPASEAAQPATEATEAEAEQQPPAEPEPPAPALLNAPAVVEPAREAPEWPPAYREPDWPPATGRPPLPTPAPVVRRPHSRGPLLLTLFVLALVAVALIGVLAATLRGQGDRGRPSSSAPSAPGETTTSQAPGTTAGGGAQPGGAVPAGFEQFSSPDRGYAVAYPSGWKVEEKRGKFNTTVFSDPKSPRTFAIYSSKPPNRDLTGASDRWERTVSGRKGFQLIRQDKGIYHGKPAVITEYTYQDKGERVHERHVNVDFGTWGYAVVASTSDGDWAAADRDVWRVVEMSLHESHQ